MRSLGMPLLLAATLAAGRSPAAAGQPASQGTPAEDDPVPYLGEPGAYWCELVHSAADLAEHAGEGWRVRFLSPWVAFCERYGDKNAYPRHRGRLVFLADKAGREAAVSFWVGGDQAVSRDGRLVAVVAHGYTEIMTPHGPRNRIADSTCRVYSSQGREVGSLPLDDGYLHALFENHVVVSKRIAPYGHEEVRSIDIRTGRSRTLGDGRLRLFYAGAPSPPEGNLVFMGPAANEAPVREWPQPFTYAFRSDGSPVWRRRTMDHGTGPFAAEASDDLSHVLLICYDPPAADPEPDVPAAARRQGKHSGRVIDREGRLVGTVRDMLRGRTWCMGREGFAVFGQREAAGYDYSGRQLWRKAYPDVVVGKGCTGATVSENGKQAVCVLQVRGLAELYICDLADGKWSRAAKMDQRPMRPLTTARIIPDGDSGFWVTLDSYVFRVSVVR